MTDKLIQRLLILGIVAVVLWFPVAYIALNWEPYGVFALYFVTIVVAAVLIVRKRPQAKS
jgi:uncharacterized protein (DUF58 family)